MSHRPSGWLSRFDPFALVAFIALSAPACSSSTSGAPPPAPDAGPSGPTLCERFTPCGGDVVGSWTAAETCKQSPETGSCAGEMMSLKDMTLSGSLVLDSGSVTQDIDLRATRTAEFDPACGGELTCGTYGAQIGAPYDACTLTTSSGGDGGSGKLCDCAWPYEQRWNQPGTYTLNGTKMAVSWSNGLYTDDYCVTGAELLIRKQTIVMRFVRAGM
jgi:hypothetical protein